MRMYILLLVSFLYCYPALATPQTDSSVEKYRHISSCLKIVDSVLSGCISPTQANQLDSQEIAKIEKLISTVKNLDDLELLGDLFRRTYAGNEDLENRSLYLQIERGEYTVVKQIAKQPGQSAADALKRIRSFHNGNATTSLELDGLIDAQKKIH